MDFTASVSIENTVNVVEKIDNGVLLTLLDDTKVFIPQDEMERIIQTYND